MYLPKCVWQYILNKANWFPARAVNRAFRVSVDINYLFRKEDVKKICAKATPRILRLYEKQYFVNYDKFIKLAANNSKEMFDYFLSKKKAFLEIGLMSKNIDIVKFAVEKGAKKIYDLTCSYGCVDYLFEQNIICHDCVLLYACRQGNLELVKSMLKKGAKHINNGLVQAIAGGNLEIVNLMIELGATDWNIGLDMACKYGRMDIIRLMIEKGADSWQRAFVGACYAGQLEAIKFFMGRYYLDMNEGMEALCHSDDNYEIVKMFLEYGANNYTDCFRSACYNNCTKLINLFIKKVDDNKNMALNSFCSNGNIEMVKFFIEKGADCFDTGLIRAIEGDHTEIINLMIEKGATNWNDGLITAAAYGNIKLMNFFIEKGATNLEESLLSAINSEYIDAINFMITIIQKEKMDLNKILVVACKAEMTKVCKNIILLGATNCSNCSNTRHKFK